MANFMVVCLPLRNEYGSIPLIPMTHGDHTPHRDHMTTFQVPVPWCQEVVKVSSVSFSHHITVQQPEQCRPWPSTTQHAHNALCIESFQPIRSPFLDQMETSANQSDDR